MSKPKLKVVEADKNPPREIFSLNGRYVIADGVRPSDVRDDAHCWLENADAVVSFLAGYFSEHGEHDVIDSREMAGMLDGVWSTFNMVYNALSALPLKEEIE